MYLLIDECCSKSLVTVAEALGHTAQRIQDVSALGAGSADRTIFDFARTRGPVFVTINRTDFVAIASYAAHPGVIVLPSVRGREIARLFKAVLPTAEELLRSEPNTFVEI